MSNPLRTHHTDAAPADAGQDWYLNAMEQLIGVVQELSHARTLPEISAIVRVAARKLTGADGATFVLRDGNQCYYADEDAISPLWKGKRFPMSMCVSGWVMSNAKAKIIDDIYTDTSIVIPLDAYRPTFVKSMAMVPIRRESPIGAIGNYWANARHPSDQEIAILQALADTTSVAIENAQLYAELQGKVRALQDSNNDLSRFAWVASHDLQEPLRTIATQVELLERRYRGVLDERAQAYIHTASEGAERLQQLIEDLLVHASAEQSDHFRILRLDHVVADALTNLQLAISESGAKVRYEGLPNVLGDAMLLTRLFQNLLSNAIKFRREGEAPLIDITAERTAESGCEVWKLCVTDNGIGIAPHFHEKIFELFQHLHSRDRYPGSGIGLATCRKVAELHGGRIWVESEEGKGSRFCFTLLADEKPKQSMDLRSTGLKE